MKHKHAELIKAWADGAEIQHKGGDGNWYDSPSYPPQMIWYDGTEYRIKPEPKPDVVVINNFYYDLLEEQWFATSQSPLNLKLTFEIE